MKSLSVLLSVTFLFCASMSVGYGEEPKPREGPSDRDAKAAAVASASNDQPAALGRDEIPADKKKAAKKRLFPAYLTPYDIMTPEDEFFFHHLEQLCVGSDIANWPLVKEIINVGEDLVDAPTLADLANNTAYITDQPRAAPIMKMVKECADILGIDPPPVFIEGDPEVNAYVTRLRPPHVLVFTSGLLHVYEDVPEELKFIIGHELGHIKSQHIKTHFLGRTVVSSLLLKRAWRKTPVGKVVIGLAFGTLLHWFRESEYTADRAGLLCVGGDVDVAKQSLLRLLHQTRQSNTLFDSDVPKFDNQKLTQSQMRLRDQPFVKVLSYLAQFAATHPFIPERCQALEAWTQTGQFGEIVHRSQTTPRKRSLVITKVSVTGVPNSDTYVPLVDGEESDPFVKVTYAQKSNSTAHQSNRKDVTWPALEWRYEYQDGAGFILDLYDYNSVTANRLIGSCRLPIGAAKPGTGKVQEDLRLDIHERSTVVERPRVVIEYRLEEHE